MREKINQKWAKFHFYKQGDEVVRIKAYPYAPSKRTEEYYLQAGDLALAVIEDDGTGPKGKSLDQLDKIYYFKNGEMIKEVNNTNEEEYTVNKSDAEELIQEVNEYLSILKNQGVN